MGGGGGGGGGGKGRGVDLLRGAYGDPLGPIEDLLSRPGSIEGDEHATAQGKVPLRLRLHSCIGLAAVR